MRKGGPTAMITIIRLTALCLLLAVRPTVLNGQLTYNQGPCAPTDIPFEVGEFAGLKVISNQISLGAHGGWRWLRLKNETGKTITRLLVLVSYLDSDGRQIFAIPYYGAPRDAPDDMLKKHPYIKTVLNRPIAPGGVFILYGTNLISTTVSPTRAKVTFVAEDFDDASSNIGGHAPVTDPMLLKTPLFFEMQADPDELPDELILAVNLDVRGRVKSVEFKQPGVLSDSMLSEIRSQIMLWSFFPATARGYAVQTDLNLLFRFHAAGIPFPAPVCPLKMSSTLPQTFVEVDIQAVGSGRWQVQYGWRYAHGEFETSEISTI
jgi:hypothetical protein